MYEPQLKYIPCRCYCAEHFIRISPDDDAPDQVELEIISTRNGSIWHRIKWALVHVFGRDDLVFADLLIKKSDLRDAAS